MMRPATQASAMENGVETSMDIELQQKVIEGIKHQFGHLVTRIEGFLAVQIGNSGPPLNIHISYKDMVNGFSSLRDPPPSISSSSTPSKSSEKLAVTTTSITASLSSSSRKNRRKAYMPMKCEDVSSPPSPPPAHASSRTSLFPRSLAPPTSTSASSTSAEDFSQSLSASINSSAPSNTNSFSVETDPMGALNPDVIQASMNQVMHSSLPVFPMNQFPTDIQLPMSIVNTVIPVPQMLGDSAMTFGHQIPTVGGKVRMGKTPEQRKIKPKPISLQGQNVGGLGAPYHKPPGTTTKRNPNKEFACNQCTERFKSLNLLTEHTTQVHLCFRCTTCNSKFTQRSNLQRHSLKHLGFKPFKCSICLKEYYRKDHLVRHIEVSHPGSEPKSSILNVMPSSDCLRILEETQAQALQAKLAKEAESSGRASAPETPVANKSYEPSPAGPSPAASDTVVINVERNQPTDLSVRSEEEVEEEEDEPHLLYGMEIVEDLMGDEDDIEEDMEDELEELEMDLSDETLDDNSLLASSNGKRTPVNGEDSLIRLPNHATESS